MNNNHSINLELCSVNRNMHLKANVQMKNCVLLPGFSVKGQMCERHEFEHKIF